MTDTIAPTQAEVKSLYDYNPDTGIFTRLCSGHGRWSGEIAGSTTRNGYRFLSFRRRPYLAHRIAWLYVHGSFPSGHLDHINRDKTDNRMSNLRIATSSQNMCNRGAKPGSKSGVKGVHWQPQTGRWRSAIAINGKSQHLGYFDTIAEARDVYAAAAARLHGDFARLV